MTKYQGILISVALYTVSVWLLGVLVSAGFLVIHLAVVPLTFRYSRLFRRHLVFANCVQWPLSIDYEDPSSSGIEGGRNISIEFGSKVDGYPVKIGIWHILPRSTYERMKGKFRRSNKEALSASMDKELANSKTPIILYFHGNANSRAASHRIQLYKFFQRMEYHTIAFDYRGYGDSTNLTPSEKGVVEDSLMVYDWLDSRLALGSKRPPVFVWGHSLGTGISSHLLGNLKELSFFPLERSEPLPMPNGLILEAPFCNIADEVAEHALATMVLFLPYFEDSFVTPFQSETCEFTFRSDEYLRKAKKLPLLILHAKDDTIVPYASGEKLYNAVAKSRSKGDAVVKLHAYENEEDLGHKWICTAKDLKQVVGDFVKEHL